MPKQQSKSKPVKSSQTPKPLSSPSQGAQNEPQGQPEAVNEAKRDASGAVKRSICEKAGATVFFDDMDNALIGYAKMGNMGVALTIYDEGAILTELASKELGGTEAMDKALKAYEQRIRAQWFGPLTPVIVVPV